MDEAEARGHALKCLEQFREQGLVLDTAEDEAKLLDFLIRTTMMMPPGSPTPQVFTPDFESRAAEDLGPRIHLRLYRPDDAGP